MKLHTVLARILFSLLFAAGAAAAAEVGPGFDVLHLSKSVYMLRSHTKIGNPTTVVSLGADGAVIVDPGLGITGPALLQTLAELGAGTETIRYVTATHHHGDHTENFELLAREAPGASRIAPQAQRERLATSSVVQGRRPLAADALPGLTFEERLTLRLNDETIEISTLPRRRGHTDGDAVVYFRDANVLYVGDYYFLDRFPIIDASGDLEGYLDNIAYLLSAFPEDCIVVPGHGRFHPAEAEASDMAAFRRYHDRLRESIAIVRQQLADGSDDERIVERGLPASFDMFSEKPGYVSAERWLRRVADYYRP